MTGPRDAGFVVDPDGHAWRRHGDTWTCMTAQRPACQWGDLPRPCDVFVWRGTDRKDTDE